MKLRWLIQRNAVTAAEVRNYAETHDLPMMQARDELINETRPVLQYHTVLGGWQDVPTEVIPHDS